MVFPGIGALIADMLSGDFDCMAGQFTALRGTFKYPKLNEPEFGNEKFPKADGGHSATAV